MKTGLRTDWRPDALAWSGRVPPILSIITLTALLRLALAGLVGLSVDESYTVAISRQFALSYFDHPPLHVWLVGAWARLLGSEQPLLLRVPDIVLFAGSTWLLYDLTASALSQRAAYWAVLAFNLAPLFTLNVAAGILPDGPLVFFSLLMTWYFDRALRVNDAQGWPLVAAGAAAGLALLSKYQAIFPVLSLGVYLVTARRRLLARPTLWLGVCVALLLFVPVLLWNGAHGWASFAFQGARALPAGFSPVRAAEDFIGQLLYLLPWTGLALLYTLSRAVRGGARDDVVWLFACTALVPIVAFSLLGFWTLVLPHWAAVGWLFAFPLLGGWLAEVERTRPRTLRRVGTATAAVVLGFVTLAASQTRTGWIDDWLPALATHDPTVDLLDWRELRTLADRLGLPAQHGFVATVSWIDAAKADYALGGLVPVLCLSADARGFAFLRQPSELRGRDALLVADAARRDWLRLARPHFDRIEPLPDLLLKRFGRPALTLHIAMAFGLQPGTAAEHPRTVAAERGR